MEPDPFTLARLEGVTYVAHRATGLGVYDYEFTPDLRVDHPAVLPEPVTAIARMGAAGSYPDRYERLRALNIRLIHSPQQYALCSELPRWYPLLEDLTARSRWYSSPPSADEVGRDLGWPVFVKGARQTSRHQRAMCVAEDAEGFRRIMEAWAGDPILWWQPVVCRQWLSLRKVSDCASNLLPITYEFRSFWYRGEPVGFGNYWRTEPYAVSERERAAAMVVARQAVERLAVPFVVVDLGVLEDGRWVVIECNDGQDAGYACVDRRALWRRIVEIEGERGSGVTSSPPAPPGSA